MTQLGSLSSCSTIFACSTNTGNFQILKGTRNRRNSWLIPPWNFLQRHSSLIVLELVSIGLQCHSPCCKVRNSASFSYLALFGKYFSKNRVLKLAQVTRSLRVCISYCIPTHQYSASATRRNVTKVNFCASVHLSVRHIFSHSLSHASPSSGVALPMNLASLCLMKYSIVIGRVGATLALGCAALGCIASTIR